MPTYCFFEYNYHIFQFEFLKLKVVKHLSLHSNLDTKLFNRKKLNQNGLF